MRFLALTQKHFKPKKTWGSGKKSAKISPQKSINLNL